MDRAGEVRRKRWDRAILPRNHNGAAHKMEMDLSGTGREATQPRGVLGVSQRLEGGATDVVERKAVVCADSIFWLRVREAVLSVPCTICGPVH